MTETPLRIRLWADMAMHLDAAQFGLGMDVGTTRASVEYIRADLAPQPQEPTPEAVERAAKAIQTATTGKPSLWRRIDETKRELYRKCARAALTAPA